MSETFKQVEKYRGIWIMRDWTQKVYHIDGSAMKLNSIEVARKIIDLHLKNLNENNDDLSNRN